MLDSSVLERTKRIDNESSLMTHAVTHSRWISWIRTITWCWTLLFWNKPKEKLRVFLKIWVDPQEPTVALHIPQNTHHWTYICHIKSVIWGKVNWNFWGWVNPQEPVMSINLQIPSSTTLWKLPCWPSSFDWENFTSWLFHYSIQVIFWDCFQQVSQHLDAILRNLSSIKVELTNAGRKEALW